MDYNDPFYNRLKNEVREMLAGALGSTHFSQEGALARVRQSLRAEDGYSDEMVRSMPEWQARYGFDEPVAPQTISDTLMNNSRPEGNVSEAPKQIDEDAEIQKMLDEDKKKEAK